LSLGQNSSKCLIALVCFLFAVGFVSQIRAVNAEALDYELFVSYVDSQGFTILAQLGVQLPQSFSIRLFVNQPVELTMRLKVGGELEREFVAVKTDFRWSYDHTTIKQNAAVEMKFSLKTKEITKEFAWAGVIVRKPIVVPRDVTEWFSPSQVAEMIRGITFTEIIKISAFALVGLALAYFSKQVLMLLSPFNGVHLTLLIASLFGCYFLGTNFSYIPYWLVILLISNVAYPMLKTARVRQIMEVQLHERNINIAGIPLYRTPSGQDAIALQTTVHALRRTFLNEHVLLNVQGNWETNWTFNAYTQLFIADAAGLLEIGKTAEEQERESGIFGVVRRLFGRKSPEYTTVFAIDLANAHYFDNFTFVTKADAFHQINKAYETLKRQYEQLDALRKADVQREIDKRFDILDELFEKPRVGRPTEGVTRGPGEGLETQRKEEEL